MRTIVHEDLLQTELVVDRFGHKLVISIFLIDGLLIDTGPFQKKSTLIPLYNEWEIEQAIITHHHEDHTGLANWLQKNKNIPIYTHSTGIPLSIKKDRIPLYRRLFWGEREAFHPRELTATFETEDYLWEVVHTPGHAEDHVALYNKEKGWMFGGDLYVHPKPKSAYIFEDIPAMIASLEKILTYDFSTYICSHQGIILDGKKAIKRKRDYLVSIREKIIKLYDQGLQIKEIRKRLFPKRHPLHYISLFENSPNHLINSILAGNKQK